MDVNLRSSVTFFTKREAAPAAQRLLRLLEKTLVKTFCFVVFEQQPAADKSCFVFITVYSSQPDTNISTSSEIAIILSNKTERNGS